MSTDAPGPPVPPAARARSTLRLHGAVILVLLLVEVLVGNLLAMAGSPYPKLTLYAHVGLAVLLVLVTAGAVGVATRRGSRRQAALAALTFAATFGAAVGGVLFLDGGGAAAALDAMEGLAGLALLGSVLLIVWGSLAASPAGA
jgi:hypothetical protein